MNSIRSSLVVLGRRAHVEAILGRVEAVVSGHCRRGWLHGDDALHGGPTGFYTGN